MKQFLIENRRIHFYETDLMGIVHHANYVRLFEEARVEWAMQKGLIRQDDSESAAQFAVLRVELSHLRALRFADFIHIDLQVQKKGARLIFEYKMWNQRNELVAEARTQHATLNSDLKPRRLSEEITKELEKEKWIETWLSSL